LNGTRSAESGPRHLRGARSDRFEELTERCFTVSLFEAGDHLITIFLLKEKIEYGVFNAAGKGAATHHPDIN